MKTYLLDIPKRLLLKNLEIDAKASLCNRSWTVFNDDGIKQVFIFNPDGSLIISTNGQVSEASWKLIPINKSIIINSGTKAQMFHPIFIDDVVFALELDGGGQSVFMIDETNQNLFRPRTLSQLRDYFKRKEDFLIEQEKETEERRRRQIDEENKRKEEERRIIEAKRKEEERLQQIREERERKRREEEQIITKQNSDTIASIRKRVMKKKKKYQLYETLITVCIWFYFLSIIFIGFTDYLDFLEILFPWPWSLLLPFTIIPLLLIKNWFNHKKDDCDPDRAVREFISSKIIEHQHVVLHKR